MGTWLLPALTRQHLFARRLTRARRLIGVPAPAAHHLAIMPLLVLPSEEPLA